EFFFATGRGVHRARYRSTVVTLVATDARIDQLVVAESHLLDDARISDERTNECNDVGATFGDDPLGVVQIDDTPGDDHRNAPGDRGPHRTRRGNVRSGFGVGRRDVGHFR